MKFHAFFWKMRVHYRVHKSLQLVISLNQLSPVYTFTPYFIHIHFKNIPFLHQGLPNGLIATRFHIKILYTFLISPMLSTCQAYIILLYFITLKTFC